MSARDRAVELLAHYFRTAFAAAGESWTSDNHVEIEQLVDAIAEMIESAPHIHADGSPS